MIQSERLPGSGTISSTVREIHNLNDCQGAAIKSTVREFITHKYCQGAPQLKGLSESDTIRTTAREWHNKQYSHGDSESK